MFLRWSVSLEGEWSCYGEGQFNGRSMAVNFLEGEWSCYRCGQCKDVREWSCYRGYFRGYILIEGE